MDLFKVKDMVEQELTDNPATRNDDRLLIKYIYRDCYGIGNQPFCDVITNTELPSFESIRRSRQKIQEHNIDLRGNEYVEKARLGEQVKFINFARGV